jgi:type I restriction enzyme S subunit
MKTQFKQTEIGLIPEEWGVVELQEVSSLITDGSHFSPSFSSDGENIIATVKDMTYSKFDFSESKKISDEEFNSLKKNGCSPKKGDLLISKDGAKCLDLMFVYDQDKEIVLLSSIAIVRFKENINPQFYRYFLLSPNAQRIMKEGYVSGSAIPRVILKNFRKVPVPQLPKSEQDNISKILSDLDLQIENLQSQNATLEAIGKALFKHWFVDFEFPDEHGKPYKSNGGKMKESELGDVPEGWKLGKIEDIAKVIGGGTPSTSKEEYYTLDGIPWISPKDLTGYKGKFISRGATDITKEGLKGSSATLLPKGTVLFSSRAPIGYCAIAENEITTNQGFKSLVPEEGMDSEYLYQFLKRNLPVIESRAHGSTFKEVNGGTMKNVEILLPPRIILEKYSNITASFNKGILNNQHQIDTLTSIRNSLLPKLMSGQILVRSLQ